MSSADNADRYSGLGQSYVPSTSSVHGRSAFLNEPIQHDHIDYFQSFAKFRDKASQAVFQPKGRLRSGKIHHFLNSSTEATSSEPNILLLPKSKLVIRELASALPRRACRTRNRIGSEAEKLEVHNTGNELPDDEEKTDLLEIPAQMMPERGRLARTMISDKVVSNEECRQATEDLSSLVSQDCTTLNRPGEKPIEGVGPVTGCGVEMIR